MRQVVLRPSMRAVLGQLKAFSTEAVSQQQHIVFVAHSNPDEIRQNPLLGQSAKFPLPGNVAAPKSALSSAARTSAAPAIGQSMPVRNILELTARPPTFSDAKAVQDAYLEESAPSTMAVELSAQACPKLMQKDLDRLFPGIELKTDKVSVLNIVQRTENDQSAWNPAMETERDALTASFIAAATSICQALQSSGHWADFIDPSSGRPYLGRFTNASLFETDDAYRKMGFRVEDLGCCKVLQHAAWGARAFVGTIFTSAPVESQTVQDMIAKLREE